MKQQHLFIDNKAYRLVITMITALIGGFLFQFMHIPIPWLLGPMIATLLGSILRKGRYECPGQVRNTGMIIVGYTIGLSMTGTALKGMLYQLPSMALMTMLLLLMCASMAYVVSKLVRSDYFTVLLGCIPGGLTQVLALAEETEGVNITIVTVMQIVRVMMIIISIPILIFSPLFGYHHTGTLTIQAASAINHAGDVILFPDILPFAVVSVLFALVGNKIRFPTAYLLGPAIGTAILQMLGLPGPQLPSVVIHAAQFMIGAYVGLLLKPNELNKKIQTITFAIVNSIMLILGALGLSLLLIKFHSVSMSTALLSLAPGGMDQMGLIAHEVNADLSIVTGYQLFRVFSIFFGVPSLLKLIITSVKGRSLVKKEQS